MNGHSAETCIRLGCHDGRFLSRHHVCECEPQGGEVGTGAGEGATGQDTGTAWVTRSTDCPEAPAQAHLPAAIDLQGVACFDHREVGVVRDCPRCDTARLDTPRETPESRSADEAYDRLHGVDGHNQATEAPPFAWERLFDQRDAAIEQRDRYRLAWQSARRRANRGWLNYHAAEGALDAMPEEGALETLARLSERSTDGRLRDAIALVRSALWDEVER